jgi:hypothetical protein
MCQFYIKWKLSLCLAYKALHHEGVWGSGCIEPPILDLGTSWRWVISFTPSLLYLSGKSPRYPFSFAKASLKINRMMRNDIPKREVWRVNGENGNCIFNISGLKMHLYDINVCHKSILIFKSDSWSFHCLSNVKIPFHFDTFATYYIFKARVC